MDVQFVYIRSLTLGQVNCYSVLVSKGRVLFSTCEYNDIDLVSV